MRLKKRYKITVVDQSRIETVAKATLSPLSIAAIAIVSFLFFSFLAAILIMVSPLKTMLPGYLKNSERTASEENLMKLDSLYNIIQLNQAYIDNMLRVTDVNRVPDDTVAEKVMLPQVDADSLLPSSPEELKFSRMMQEREKYHLSVLAPLAAEGMVFVPVNESSVFLTDSRESETGVIALAKGSEVSTIADGAVLAVYFSPSENGYVVVIQHPKGFSSRLSHLGSPLVNPGDIVTAGQAVAIQSAGSGRKGSFVKIQMWHDGMPVVPYQYIEDSSDAFKSV